MVTRSQAFKQLLSCFLGGLPRLLAVNSIHVAVFLLAGLCAFLLRFEFVIPRTQQTNLLLGLLFWIPIKVLVFRLARIDRTAWRFASLYDIWKLVCAASGAGLISAVAIILFVPWRFPRSLYVLDLLLTIAFLGACRLTLRSLLEAPRSGSSEDESAFIYGAGEAGVGLLREIRQNRSLKYRVCGFIDDERSKRRMLIQGIPVLGSGSELSTLASKHNVKLVLIAIPSANGRQKARILDLCASAHLTFQTVPSLFERVDACSRTVLRDVALEDLLCRTPVRLEHDLVGAKLANQVVLVTGAAGSIGSELCRQIARFNPKLLVGLDIGETALFYLDQELRRSFEKLCFEPVIGSIQHANRLCEVFRHYQPAIIFHAAAYKHVPMMEANIFEAVENNILGTYNAASVARAAGCSDFVMISSDKAVRPTSIMGLTKRVAEMIVRSIPEQEGKFVSVRFGNVLGSNGSVVPIFRQQIASGGPVTVTHAEMRRYFMTIPEAAQLVLQASTMGKGREIFVLEMGDQIKIVDLAKSLILLSGLRPEEDIRIQFTGIRPGEKLFEEINHLDEETLPTYHEKIKIFAGNGSFQNLEGSIDEIQRLCAARDLRLIIRLKELVTDYSPSASILQHLLDQNQVIKKSPSSTYTLPNLQVSAAGA